MLIAFSALNTQGEFQDFSCQLQSLEAALDVVSSMAAHGNQLLEVVLIEQGSMTPLPINVFDGQSFSAPIQALEQEWVLALKQGVRHEIVAQDRYDRMRQQRINRHQTTIIQLEQALILAQQRLQRMQNRRSPTPYHALILSQLEGTLERYQQNMAREQRSLQKLIDQLQLS